MDALSVTTGVWFGLEARWPDPAVLDHGIYTQGINIYKVTNLDYRLSYLTIYLPWATSFLLFPQQSLRRINMYVLLYEVVLKRLFDTKSKLRNIDIPIPRSVDLSSEPLEISLRHTLINFLNTIEYSFTSYPESKDLELAVRKEILSFGMDLRPQWEARLRTACALVGMAYISHPIEIQFSIAVCNPFPFSQLTLLTHSAAY